MKRQRVYELLIWLGILTLLLQGCHRKIVVTNLPPGVSQQQVIDWYTATGALKVIAETSNSAMTSLVQMNRTGAFPDGPSYVATISAMGRMSQAGLHAKSILEAAPDNFNLGTRQRITGDVQIMLKELETLNQYGLVGIKDPQTKLIVQAWLRTFETAINVENALVTSTH